jgi:hypothetical protein
VRLPQFNLGRGLALDAIPRMVYLSSRRLLPSFLPQLDRLYQGNVMRGEDASNAGDNIPVQKTLTRQIALHWQPFKDLKQVFAVSRRAEQLRLHSQQRIVVTVEDSVLRAEMGALESQEEDAPKRVLWYKPLGFLGVIRPHRRDEAWSASLWQSFFAGIPALKELPLSACACRNFTCDVLGDHVSTCTAHSGAKKAHDWAVEQLADLFCTTHRVKTQQVAKSRGQ